MSAEDMKYEVSSSEHLVKEYERHADIEEKRDRKLAEHTRKVARSLRDRAEYIKSRLDV